MDADLTAPESDRSSAVEVPSDASEAAEDSGTAAPGSPDEQLDDPETIDPPTVDPCQHCGSGFIAVGEETDFAPACVVFACTSHQGHDFGDCPGTILRRYEDGHTTRRAYAGPDVSGR